MVSLFLLLSDGGEVLPSWERCWAVEAPADDEDDRRTAAVERRDCERVDSGEDCGEANDVCRSGDRWKLSGGGRWPGASLELCTDSDASSGLSFPVCFAAGPSMLDRDGSLGECSEFTGDGAADDCTEYCDADEIVLIVLARGTGGGVAGTATLPPSACENREALEDDEKREYR
jgi:hypothetical protein